MRLLCKITLSKPTPPAQNSPPRQLTQQQTELVKTLKSYVSYIYQLESAIQINLPNSFDILDTMRKDNPVLKNLEHPKNPLLEFSSNRQSPVNYWICGIFSAFSCADLKRTPSAKC